MAENREAVTNELLFELLKQVRATQHEHTTALLEVKERHGFLEQQYASISRRVDRIDERIDRIERRLDLVSV